MQDIPSVVAAVGEVGDVGDVAPSPVQEQADKRNHAAKFERTSDVCMVRVDRARGFV